MSLSSHYIFLEVTMDSIVSKISPTEKKVNGCTMYIAILTTYLNKRFLSIDDEGSLYCDILWKPSNNWRVLSQNGLTTIFEIFKVRAPSYYTK